MTINYPKIIFLNLVAAYLVIQALVYRIDIISIFEAIVLAGFVLSFFIKENLLVHYSKLALINSLFFGFLFALFFTSDIFIHDSQSVFTLTGLFYSSLFFGALYFFGALAGIIPQGIRERIRKQGMGNLSENQIKK